VVRCERRHLGDTAVVGSRHLKCRLFIESHAADNIFAMPRYAGGRGRTMPLIDATTSPISPLYVRHICHAVTIYVDVISPSPIPRAAAEPPLPRLSMLPSPEVVGSEYAAQHARCQVQNR